jgi:hypothetical protein
VESHDVLRGHRLGKASLENDVLHRTRISHATQPGVKSHD